MKKFKITADSGNGELTRISNTPNRYEFEAETCAEIDELVNLLQEIKNKCSDISDYGIQRIRFYLDDVEEKLERMKHYHVDIDDGFRSEDYSFAHKYYNDID